MSEYATCPQGHRHEITQDASGFDILAPVLNSLGGHGPCVFNRFRLSNLGIKKEGETATVSTPDRSPAPAPAIGIQAEPLVG
jgi:hypothetical protein